MSALNSKMNIQFLELLTSTNSKDKSENVLTIPVGKTSLTFPTDALAFLPLPC